MHHEDFNSIELLDSTRAEEQRIQRDWLRQMDASQQRYKRKTWQEAMAEQDRKQARRAVIGNIVVAAVFTAFVLAIVFLLSPAAN